MPMADEVYRIDRYHPRVTMDAAGRQTPTAAHEERFWALLEAAWAPLGAEPNRARRALSARRPGEAAEIEGLEDALRQMLDNVAAGCRGFSAEELTDLDRVLERKLYDLDREELQAVTDGSDDGFLYARGFVVAMGRAFYDAVSAEPGLAVVDAECEDMCYFFAHLHQERFGAFPATGSGISRESCSNVSGWPR
jgi:hypothetical protein